MINCLQYNLIIYTIFGIELSVWIKCLLCQLCICSNQKIHVGCAFAEPELLSYRKPKLVVQNEKNGHKNTNNSHNYHENLNENRNEIEIYQGNS